MAFTSVLQRATNTLNIILTNLKLDKIPVEKTWKLNERHYGSLTGEDKLKTKDSIGENKVILTEYVLNELLTIS